MKIFNTSQVRLLDKYTIEHEPISSIDLMERAAETLYWEFVENYPHLQPVCIFAGPGNNGGDALALARKLLNSGYSVNVILLRLSNLSSDCELNLQHLIKKYPLSLTQLNEKFIAPEIDSQTIIVDGLFGSGLSRPLTGIYAEAVNWINQSGCEVISIDIPSGLMGEENKLNESLIIVKANLTLSFQFPKLAFFLAENSTFLGNWKILDIGIHPQGMEQTVSDFYYLEEMDIAPIIKSRPKFSHKGTFGHTLIIAGCKGMAGAAVLSGKAALRSGAGLVTVHGPEANRIIVQTVIPEVIYQPDVNHDCSTQVDSFEIYNAIAIGPGIGTNAETAEMLQKTLSNFRKPCIIDADALNIISQHQELLQLIPKNSILTPHPKEFDRLFGATASSHKRILKAHQAAKKYNVIIILKGAHTLIATPYGQFFFNSTGNAGMATAGSGDVLSGILVGLLAQGYTPIETAKIGVFLHGKAGDLALKKESKESLIASDIIKHLGKAYKSILI